MQKRHSKLTFGRLSAREFDATCNKYSVDVRVRADVFVFAVQTPVQTQRKPASYDVLDIPMGILRRLCEHDPRNGQARLSGLAESVSTPWGRSIR